MATAFAVAVRRAGRGTDVLALMPEAGGALPDLEAAGFAKIVPPRIDAAASLGFLAAEGLRADGGRRFLERKTDLRIGGEIGASAAPTHAAAGDDVAARVIAHVGELRRQRLDRLALAAERIGEVVDEDRARDLHFDRPGEDPRRQTRACA